MDASEAGKILATRGPQIGGQAMRSLLDAAINGVGKVPGAKAVAAHALVRAEGAEAAIDRLVSTHIKLAAAQGVVTNLGGLATAALLMPANIAGVAIVQIRLVACIAHLRGYDIDDLRVRTAMSLCLLGETGVDQVVASQEVPVTPIAIATAPVFDEGLEQTVSQKVLAELTSRIGGRQMAVMVIRRVPLLGGGVSGAMDGWFTSSVGAYARTQFPSRRRIMRSAE